MKIPYPKKPTLYAEQLEKLTARGMHVMDGVRAQHTLQDINYYRLGAH